MVGNAGGVPMVSALLISAFSVLFLSSSLALADTFQVTIGNETGGQEKINDTYVKQDESSTVFGSSSFLVSRESSFSCNCTQRIYIRVDFSSIANITAITNATLYLSEDDGLFTGNGAVELFDVSDTSMISNFKEYENIYWDNQPCGALSNLSFNDSCNRTAQSSAFAFDGGVIGLNVIDSAQKALGNGQIFLVVINSTDRSANEQRFESKESSAPNRLRPYLYLVYEAPAAPPSGGGSNQSSGGGIWDNNTVSVFLNSSHSGLALNVSVANFTDVTSSIVRSSAIFENGVSIAGKYLQLSGGTLTGTLNSRSILPTSFGVYDLGISSAIWSNVWANTFRGNLTGVTANLTGAIYGGQIYEAGRRFPQSASCSGTDKVTGLLVNGSFTCGADQTGSSSFNATYDQHVSTDADTVVGNEGNTTAEIRAAVNGTGPYSITISSILPTVNTTQCSAGFCIVGVKGGNHVTITAKGSLTGTTAAQTIRLNVNSSTVDSVGYKQAANADKVPFTLGALYVPSVSGTLNVSINSTGGTLNDRRIIVQVVS